MGLCPRSSRSGPIGRICPMVLDHSSGRERTGTLASEISATEEVINGRRFLSIDYVTPADPGTACESLNFKRITLSYAYPVKPYAFVVSAGMCTQSPDPFQPSISEDIRELGIAMRSFREWDLYRDAQLGWSVSVAPGWTSNGWVHSKVLSEERSRTPFNTGLLFIEDEARA